jgi:membrane protease YdiL (CAAX protease family)
MTASRDVHALGVQAARLAARGDPSAQTATISGSRGSLAILLAAYGVAATASVGICVALGRNPLQCDAWLGTRGPASWLLSLGLGVILGATTTFATRALVRRYRWARALHRGLRPAVLGAGNGSLAAVAFASAAGEELLFRGLLVPAVGVVASSVVFGALHQMRGRARWGWMAWATVMGLLFGSVFAATGSLAGPLVAHMAINHANLRFLRDAPAGTKRAALGGLLRRP